MKPLTLKEARLRRGLTQDELSARSGIDQTTISSLETGRKSHPRFRTGLALARALDVDPAQLRFGVPTPQAGA